MRVNLRLMICGCSALLSGCGPKEIKPVDIYPEDMCAYCRMAVSDQRFAAEAISDVGEAFKFDDIGCLEEFFKSKPPTLKVATVFYKDYPTKRWLAVERATVVETGVMTPMGSGRVAFADSSAAQEFRMQHPRTRSGGEPPVRQPAIHPPTRLPGGK